jgi:cytoskeletal protein CcmA (bactofilin family)
VKTHEVKQKNIFIIAEKAINLIAEETHIEGKIIFDQVTRVQGTLRGEVISKPESTLILAQTSVIEGNIQADTLIVDGFVRGDIFATSKVTLTSAGRVIGNIKTPRLVIDFGAYFEGNSSTTLS